MRSPCELSEKLSDSFGIDVKYGGGPVEIRDLLSGTSKAVAVSELVAQAVPRIRKLAVASLSSDEVKSAFDPLITAGEELTDRTQQMFQDALRKLS